MRHFESTLNNDSRREWYQAIPYCKGNYIARAHFPLYEECACRAFVRMDGSASETRLICVARVFRESDLAYGSASLGA